MGLREAAGSVFGLTRTLSDSRGSDNVLPKQSKQATGLYISQYGWYVSVSLLAYLSSLKILIDHSCGSVPNSVSFSLIGSAKLCFLTSANLELHGASAPK